MEINYLLHACIKRSDGTNCVMGVYWFKLPLCKTLVLKWEVGFTPGWAYTPNNTVLVHGLASCLKVDSHLCGRYYLEHIEQHTAHIEHSFKYSVYLCSSQKNCFFLYWVQAEFKKKGTPFYEQNNIILLHSRRQNEFDTLCIAMFHLAGCGRHWN